MRQAESLGRVYERTRSFSWGVESNKEEDEGCNQRQSCCAVRGDVERQACCEKSPEHVGEGCQKESTAPPTVDCVKCRYGEDEHGHAKAPRDEQSNSLAESGVDKNRGRIESDNVD